MTDRMPKLTNLLPRQGIRALRREYFVRVVTVALALGVVALIIHGALLMPSYLYARAEVSREQAELDRINASSSSEEEKEISARVGAVKADITYLGRLRTSATASGAIKAVLAVPHPSIALSGFTFTAAVGTSTPASMTISGTADTRDSLRQYVGSLGALPYVSNADLPISAYAKDADIPFTITLTGTLTP